MSNEMTEESENSEVIGAEVSIEEDLESSPGETVAKKRFRGSRYSDERSAVWDHFDCDPSTKQSKCHHCAFVSSDKNPSNLSKHLRRKHKEAAADVEKKTAKKRPLSATSVGSSASASLESPDLFQTKLSDLIPKKVVGYEKSSKMYKELMNALCILFATQSLPHLLVQAKEFIQFMQLLNPKFELPNRQRLSKEISNVHENLKGKIMDDLKEVRKVCIVLDIWTKKGLSESYLGVLIKYFHPISNQRKMALIALKKMDGSHTAESIQKSLQDIFQEWAIDEEMISFYVTDSGSNIVKALKHCMIELAPVLEQEEEDEEDLISLFDPTQMVLNEHGFEEEAISDDDLDDELFCRQLEQESAKDLDEFDQCEHEHNAIFGYQKRIPCVAHQLTCVVRKCIDKSKDFQPLIRSAFKLVSAINKSMLRKGSLLEFNDNRGLLSPSQTRWIYTYHVLVRLIGSREAVERVINEYNLADVALSSFKWKQLEQLRDLLAPFASAVNDLEGDLYTTLSKVLPAIVDLIETMNEKKANRDMFGKAASAIKDEMENRFAYILNQQCFSFQPAYLTATILDPNFMIRLSLDQRNYCINFILKELTNSLSVEDQSLSVGSRGTSSSSPSSKYRGFFKRANEQQKSVQGTDEKRKILRAKLEAYIEETHSPVSAFQFWVSKQEIYTEISSYALNLLTVPASSAGIERVFSLAAIVQGKLRHRLGAGSTEKELMIKVNRDYIG